MKKNIGFTLMELLIVIAIVAVLAGAVVSRIGNKAEDARIAKVKSELDQLVSAYHAFYRDMGYWPVMFGNLLTNIYPWTVLDETQKEIPTPAGAVFNGPYVEVETLGGIPLDPWGMAYMMTNKPNDVKVMFFVSRGKDKILFTNDDIWVLAHRFN